MPFESQNHEFLPITILWDLCMTEQNGLHFHMMYTNISKWPSEANPLEINAPYVALCERLTVNLPQREDRCLMY